MVDQKTFKRHVCSLNEEKSRYKLEFCTLEELRKPGRQEVASQDTEMSWIGRCIPFMKGVSAKCMVDPHC